MDIYNIFFSISILTDTIKFQEQFISQGGRPYYNLKRFDWDLLSANIRDLLVKDHPRYRKRVFVSLFDDSLEAATKPTLSENQNFLYLKELVLRANANNFNAHDLRNAQWITTYERSAPPQDFHGVIRVEDDGTVDVIEAVIGAIIAHFYAAYQGPTRGPMMMALLYSQKLIPHCQLSGQMHSLFSKSFDHPFSSDVSTLFLNEGIQERMLLADSMLEYEAASCNDQDSVLSMLGF